MTNFFTPQQKLDQTTKDNLTRWYQQLNPAQLRRDIATLQDQLFAVSAAKGHPNLSPPCGRPGHLDMRQQALLDEQGTDDSTPPAGGTATGRPPWWRSRTAARTLLAAHGVRSGDHQCRRP